MTAASFHWPEPPNRLSLPFEQVHVWCAALDQAPPVDELLSGEERERAARFRRPLDGRRFAAARGILRSLLGRYLGLEPGHVRFGYGTYGKPELVDCTSQGTLRFNVSHSGGVALYALRCQQAVGIDVEGVRPLPHVEALAERICSTREWAQWNRLPPTEQSELFYRLWTCKEAFVKARGEGLGFGVDRIDVAVSAEGPSRLLAIGGDLHEAGRWFLHELLPAVGFPAALVGEGQPVPVSCWQWPS